MQEDKVRKGFEVANELAASCPSDYKRDAFIAVFHAMLSDELFPVPHAKGASEDEFAQPQ